ncbi:phosphotransferase family protein [Persicimonas caeni]|uniref:Phosphotransferase family protein n=1 Tax=Persicimonas caeni TaxID=2292766 RepID=A0A4Y6PT91_PERCE|nr:phosphotransferase family protein [Persicimonas caeni]QDG51531.1 phosphotransferase family protein [Persicimonas caeni]QED32752.1 phosphotransferase family protein [Persicimonas caeni]
MTHIDQPKDVRSGEELDTDALRTWLDQEVPELSGDIAVKQFPSGHSNLTYMLQVDGKEVVLRRPPFGAEKIAKGHDMSREYTILSHLDGVFDKIPDPIAYCDDAEVIGAPFYLMERVEGVILRGAKPKVDGLDEQTMRGLSEAFVDTLAEVHAIDLEAAGLEDFGKPEGYVERQVTGWIGRYKRAQTDEIPAMDRAGEWLEANMPAEVGASIIHNDFKYDNLVLDPDDLTKVRAILDWEMATVGDPLMDLGTSLAYWVEPDDPDVIKAMSFGPTVMPGNFTRRELVDRYAEKSGLPVDDIVFYFVYGLYKVAVIGQQIYFRFKEGDTDDPRFAMLIHAVKALGDVAQKAIDEGKIEGLG